MNGRRSAGALDKRGPVPYIKVTVIPRRHAALPAALLLLSCAIAVQAQDPPAPETDLAHQQQVLARYRLDAPPDLAGFGVRRNPDGLYVWAQENPHGRADGLVLTDDELSAAIEQSIQAAARLRAQRDAAPWFRSELKRRFPGPDVARWIDGLPDASVAQLWREFVLQRGHRMQAERDLRDFASRLQGASDQDVASALEAFYDRNPFLEPPEVDPESPGGDAAPTVEIRGDVGWSRSLPPPISVHAEMIIGRLSRLGYYDLRRVLGEVKNDRSLAAALKPEFIRLLSFRDGETRALAAEALGRMRDDALDGDFAALLNDPDLDVRQHAARALGASLGRAVRSETGEKPASYAALAAKAPRIVSALALAPNSQELEAGYIATDSFDYLNLMPDDDRRTMLEGFQDPVALLAWLGLSTNSRIREHEGLHTAQAKELFARIRALSGEKHLSELLEDPRLASELKTRILARLMRYDLLESELRRDPALAGLLPRLLLTGHLSPQSFLAVLQLAWHARPREFSRALLRELETPDPAGKRLAALLLTLNRERLPAPERRRLEKAASKVLPAGLLERANSFSSRPLYMREWPRDRLGVGLAMTQREHADLFIQHMRQNGYTVRPGAARNETLLERDLGGVRIRVEILVLPSRPGGWVVDRGRVDTALAGYFRRRDIQVVAYRGHVGDYDQTALGKVKSFDKAFFDFGCDSSYDRAALASCRNCAFFGTTTASLGPANNAFLRVALELLAQRLDHRRMETMFESTFPESTHRYTGPWSTADLFEELSRSD